MKEMIKMAKTTTNIYIDSTLKKKCKILNMNISKVCENALRARIDNQESEFPEIKEIIKEKNIIENNIKKLKSDLESSQIQLATIMDQLEDAHRLQKEKQVQEEEDKLLIGKAIQNTNILRSGM
jgi:BioD-like phosphotransacetylase family protein